MCWNEFYEDIFRHISEIFIHERSQKKGMYRIFWVYIKTVKILSQVVMSEKIYTLNQFQNTVARASGTPSFFYFWKQSFYAG